MSSSICDRRDERDLQREAQRSSVCFGGGNPTRRETDLGRTKTFKPIWITDDNMITVKMVDSL